jgi:hypothetical protein
VIVAKRQRRLSSIDEIVLSMYAGIQADDHLIEAAEPPRPLLH